MSQEELTNDIKSHLSSVKTTWAEIQKQNDRKKVLEVESDTKKWMSVAQAAAGEVLSLMRERGIADQIEDEGFLLEKLRIDPQNVQWCSTTGSFY